MKRLILILLVLTPSIWTLNSCNEEPPKTCHSSPDWNPINIDFKANINAHYTDGTPVAGVIVRVLFYKIPCGQPAKGHQEWTYNLDSNGHYLAGVMNYNINHEEDLIVAKLFINDGYDDLEIYRQAHGYDLENYANGDTYIFDFTLDDMPL